MRELKRIKRRWNHMFQLQVFFFWISMTFSVLPYQMVPIYGLLGEVRETTVLSELEISNIQAAKWKLRFKNQKQRNGLNAWFALWMVIIFFIFYSFSKQFLIHLNIVLWKVRMNC